MAISAGPARERTNEDAVGTPQPWPVDAQHETAVLRRARTLGEERCEACMRIDVEELAGDCLIDSRIVLSGNPAATMSITSWFVRGFPVSAKTMLNATSHAARRRPASADRIVNLPSDRVLLSP
jgi:hypothetical protein